jgi:hypothetical protein
MHFLGPIGEEWNSSLQIEHRATLMSASGTGSRNTSLFMGWIMPYKAQVGV